MNSLLQCLFFSPDFRAALYDWAREQGEVDDTGIADASPREGDGPDAFTRRAQLRSMALVFSHMQLNERTYHKPLCLVGMLQMPAHIQQDASEFARKLLEHVEVVANTGRDASTRGR